MLQIMPQLQFCGGFSAAKFCCIRNFCTSPAARDLLLKSPTFHYGETVIKQIRTEFLYIMFKMMGPVLATDEMHTDV